MRQQLDPEDVVQSAFRSFFVRQAEGHWELGSCDGLWALLTVLTLRKCGHRLEYFRAARRDVQREADADNSDAPFQAIDREPTPAEAAMLAEAVEFLIRSQTERDRRILELKLQGESIVENAGHIGCSENTVGRVLERARKRLQRFCTKDTGGE